MRMALVLYIQLYILIAPLHASANTDVLQVSSLEQTSISLHGSLYQAEGGAVSSSKPFQVPNESAFQPSVATIASPADRQIWYRFKLHNDLEFPSYAYLRIPNVILGDMYVVAKGASGLQKVALGTSIPEAGWPEITGQYIVPIMLQSDEVRSVYFYLDSQSTIPFQPMLGSYKAILSDYRSDNISKYVVAGFIAALIFYSVFAMAISGIINIYRYYLYHACLLFIFVLYSNNWLLLYLKDWPWVYGMIYSTVLSLETIMQLIFIRVFFQTWLVSPRWDRVIQLLFIVYSLIFVMGFVAEPAVMIDLMSLVSLVVLIIQSIMAVNFWYRRFPSSHFICSAFLVYFASVIVSIAAFYGLMPINSWTRDAFQIGICLQLLLFALAVANQTRIYRDRETASRIEADNAKKESAAKTNFLTHMSHELRTPLNGVIGMAQLLEKTEQNEQQRFYSNTIVTSGHLLLTLINNILDYNKINTGKLVLESRPFDFDQALSDCVDVFLPTTLDKNIPVFVYIQPDVPVFQVGDEYRIKQILVNLIGNALKFTEKGKVEIYVSHPVSESGQKNMQIRIVDTGIGMDRDSLTTIFDEFRQEDTTTTRRFGGSGLGLSIIKGIVQNMGGEISVSSKKGAGSCFAVLLPVQVDDARERHRADTLNKINGRKILLVTDDEYVQEMLSTPLVYWGGELIIEPDRYSAKDIAFKVENSIDCIVIHIRKNEEYLPVVDDYQSLNIPVLLLYMHSLLPADYKLSKNISSTQLPKSLYGILIDIVRCISGHQETSISQNSANGMELSELKVLLVEDNRVNQAVAKGFLNCWNITPDIADNGKQAVELFRKNHYSLILMDCEMPVMDGYEAASLIREMESPEAPVTIVALTAHALSQEHQHCLDAGMDSVITKPLSLEQLKKIIQEFLYARTGASEQ